MSLSHGSKIPTNGLVLCLDAANPKSYPGSGTTWYDLSSNGNNASFAGTPTISNGIVTFNGTSDFATITTDGTGSLNFQNEQTVLMWLKHSFTSGRRNPWDQAYGGYGTWTHEAGNNMNAYFGTNGGNGSPYKSDNNGSTPRNVWNMLTRGRDLTYSYWWNNEVNYSTVANPYGQLPVTTNNIRIGNGYAGYWEGEMGVVLAYNRALTDSEVKTIFNAYRGRFGI